jgi:5-methylcytosine-specific restriction endonuclease McrA
MSNMLVEAPCWSEARAKHLAELDEARDAACRSAWQSGREPREVASELKRIERERKRVAEDPRWLAKRPGRRMPPATRVAEYWSGQDIFWLSVADPRCFGCNRPAETWGQFERAHLVDRACDGLDHAANLAMICGPCHRVMPMFLPGEWEAAILWVLTR